MSSGPPQPALRESARWTALFPGHADRRMERYYLNGQKLERPEYDRIVRELGEV